MEILFLLTGLIIGAGVSWLIFKLKYPSSEQISNEAYNALDKEKCIADERLKDLKLAYEKLEDDLKHKIFSETDLRDSLITAQAESKGLREKLENQKNDISKLHEQMTIKFENMAAQIMDQNSKRFSTLQQERIGLILNPLKEKIAAFEQKVDETYKQQALESGILKHEIKQLASLNLQMSEDAKNLTMALKGDNKVQGNWGEIVLERVLEGSGLKKDVEYIIQGSEMQLKDHEGNHLKPDVIVLLPEKKHIVIDAKASLKAYEAYANCQNQEEQQRCLQQHILSVKNHVRILSEKYYQQASGLNTPDFVIMFLPIEASFSAALRSDQGEIFKYAWERKVVIVSPTTLLATLRTVASIWKNEKQNRNALKIAEESGRLYDKFHAFVNDMEKVGKGIQSSQSAYEDAMKKLTLGKGNLITRAEKLKMMGINAKKSLKLNGLSIENEIEESGINGPASEVENKQQNNEQEHH